MTNKELTEAVEHLLQREQESAEAQRQERIEQAQVRRRRREENSERLTRSVAVIKWCVAGITTVVFLALVAVILVAMEVEREAERIKSRVQEIQREAELIRDKIRHPLETIGGAAGRKLEEKIGEAIGQGG